MDEHMGYYFSQTTIKKFANVYTLKYTKASIFFISHFITSYKVAVKARLNFSYLFNSYLKIK